MPNNARMENEKEAQAIDTLQKGILEIVHKEKPFDVFICYKETAEDGRRTPNSVIANDIYHQLTQEGFKVFYAAITLEDKLGQAYEPYIFAALNSAKVMLAIGTKPEYFSAVWVKNEWSRYLKVLIKEEKPAPQQAAAPVSSTAPLLKRAFMFLEDGDWNSANEYCEKVLDLDLFTSPPQLHEMLHEEIFFKKVLTNT